MPGTRNVLHVVNDLDTFRFALFTDPEPVGATPAEFNTQANWVTNLVPTAAEADNVSETMTSFGISGAFLTYRFSVPNDNHLVLRRFDPATGNFTAPRNVEGASEIDDSVDYPTLPGRGRAPAHRLALAVRRRAPALHPLRQRRRDLHGTREPRDEGDVRRSPGLGQRGRAGMGGLVGDRPGPVRVVALDPRPETGGTTPARRSPRAWRSTAPASHSPRREVRRPRRVVPRHASWKRSKRKGNVFVRITRTDFSSEAPA